MSVAIREHAFYPTPDHPHAVGLLLAQEDGRRVTYLVDAEWLRTFLAGHDAGADLSGLAMPPSACMPAHVAGWPDEWHGRERSGNLGVLQTTVEIVETDGWDVARATFTEAMLGPDA